MERQPVEGRRTLLLRTRRRSADLTPQELVSRLIHARKQGGGEVTYDDYCRARSGRPDIDRPRFAALLATCEGDPGFSWQEHLFCPTLRDPDGRTYEVLERLPDRIRLVREDGVQGYTTHEESVSFFTQID